MQRSTLTLGLGVAAVAAIALAPRLQGLLSVPKGPMPVALSANIPEVVAPEAVIVEVESQLAAPPRPAPPVPEPLPVRPTRDGPIPEVHEPRPVPATVAEHDGVIPMKTGSNGHVDDLPELDQQEIELWWDDCPACGMG